MSSDILASIDTTLEDWATAQSAADAMRWQPGPFCPLAPQQLDTVRQVAHDTGLDGYAAWLAVSDVMDHGTRSPYAHLVWPEGSGPLGRQRSSFAPAAGAMIYDTSANTVWQWDDGAWLDIGFTDGPITITLDTSGWEEGLARVTEALSRLTGSSLTVTGKMDCAFTLSMLGARNHRRHIARCRACSPYSNPRPSVNGAEYHRRRKARARRKR